MNANLFSACRSRSRDPHREFAPRRARSLLKLLMIFPALASCPQAASLSAAEAGQLDPTFAPILEFEGGRPIVHSLQRDPDGRLIVGGMFTAVNGVERRWLARLLQNGDLEAAFTPNDFLTGTVYATAAAGDGKMIVSGQFTDPVSNRRYPVARLNPDGSLDTSFVARSVFPEFTTIYSVIVEPGGRILAGGSFRSVDGRTQKGVARLNADGTVDATFAPGEALDLTGARLALQSDGRIVLVRRWAGAGTNNIARLTVNGTLDPGFSSPVVTSNSFSIVDLAAVRVQADDGILISGGFTSVNGISRRGVFRLKPDGALDDSFVPPSDSVWVTAIALQSDGRILAADAGRKEIRRLHHDGSLDPSFLVSTASGFPMVAAINLSADGYSATIGGTFQQINGQAREALARVFTVASPQLTSRLTSEGSVLEVSLKAEPGRTYRIETSTDLISWSALDVLPASEPAVSILDSDFDESHRRFYRAVLVP